MRNVAASYLLCSCRANAVQQSGNPAAAAPPSNAQVCSFPTHPTLRYSARAPRPCFPLLLPASLLSPARLHNVCAPRANPRKPALASSPLPHASTRRIVPLVRWRCLYRRLYGACDGNPWPLPAAAAGRLGLEDGEAAGEVCRVLHQPRDVTGAHKDAAVDEHDVRRRKGGERRGER